MTFETTTDAEGTRVCFIDGFWVPDKVFDTLLPARMFPVDTGLTEAEALDLLAKIKAETPPAETYKGPMFATAITGAKPLKSDALAVHPRQIEAAIARNKRHGLTSLRYDRRGRPVFTDSGQRRALMKIESVRQMNSAYGY